MSRRLGLVVLLIPLALGCKGSSSDKGGSDGACAKAKVEGPIAWIDDDYASALACAKQKNVPLVLDLWAPWCHTCLSMQSTVFVEDTLKATADRFVFASFDTDKEENAAVVAKFPLSAWPTFYVVAPNDEAVLARFVGSASLAQFTAFLDAGAAARAGVAGADQKLLAAERALAAKDYATAEKELAAALEAAPATWVRKPDALVSLISTLSKRGNHAGCVDLAIQGMLYTGNSASAADFISVAVGCGKERLAADPQKVAVLRQAAMTRLEQLIDDPKAPLSFDDRSDAMVTLRELYQDVGRNPDAINLAEKQRALLDDAAKKASGPVAAATYNWHRAEVYAFLGRPLEIVPALEKSANDLPNEYDPRARLGWVYLKANKLPEVEQWTDAALKLVYGPRKGRVLAQRAEIAKAKGDVAAEKQFRAEAVKLWESLPPGQQSPDSLAKAKEALAKVDAPTAPPSTN